MMAAPAMAQKKQTKILFLFDASGSMYGKWGGNLKIAAAKNVLSTMVDSLSKLPDVQLALRVYGHQAKSNIGDCQDTKLEVGFRPNNIDAIQQVIRDVVPKGITPIAYSLEQAGNDFNGDRSSNNVIILITDGVEECKGDPCAVSLALQRSGVVLKPFVIGLGMDKDMAAQLKCIGKFYNASSQKGFSQIMRLVVSQVVESTTVRLNLLDHQKEPTETNVGVTFTDSKTGLALHSLVHTLNEQKEPDLIQISPLPLYDIKVHTLPPVVKKSVPINEGKHNDISIPTPQGHLVLKMIGSMQYPDLKCVVYKAGTRKIVNVQAVGSAEKYLADSYDLEVLSYPRISVKGVKVVSKDRLVKEFPNPGQLVLNISHDLTGAIYSVNDHGLSLVKRLDQSRRTQISYLQPGNYRIVYRRLRDARSIYSRTVDFEIKSSGTTPVKLN